MKKVLSLLLVCAMIFSLALVGSAAGEGYTVTNGTINATHGRFYLNVASKTVAGSGYLTIKYDPEKVTLLKQIKTQTGEDDEGNPTYSTTYEAYTEGNFAVAQSGCSFAAQKADVSKGNVVVQWFNTGKVTAGANVFRLWFEAKDKAGDNFNDKTFTVIEDADERVALGAEKGPIYVGTDAGDVTPSADAITWSYKNADVSSAPIVEDKWEAGEEAITDEFKAGLADVNVNGVAVDYVRAVAVFGKNAAGTTYTVKFGDNTYEGEAVVGKPWAMVLYDDGSADHDLIGDVESYAYTVTADGTTWSGNATVFAK